MFAALGSHYTLAEQLTGAGTESWAVTALVILVGLAALGLEVGHQLFFAPKLAKDQLHRWERVESWLSISILALMMTLPVAAVLIRWTLGQALAGANLWVQALNLWIAFAGGSLAARAGRHLALSTGEILKLSNRASFLIKGTTSTVATAITAVLAYASLSMVLAETATPIELAGGIPIWWMYVIMPVGFLVMAIRLAIRGNDTWAARVVSLLSVVLVASLALVPEGGRLWVVYGGTGIILAAVALGAPLFTAMGGVGMLLFFGAPIPVNVSAVPLSTLSIIQDPTLASLPLFTLAGYLLAEGGASRRLVRLFDALFGWLPGGVAAAAVLVCAFFTTFTGASGVTILALGGLLLPALQGAGYTRKFSVGLLVASGSIGLLFPPSLPVILYGVQAQIPITDLFKAGALPGIVLILLMVGMGVSHSLRHPIAAPPHLSPAERAMEVGRALWAAKLEMLLPVLVLFGIFGGLLTIFEAAAFTAAYAFLSEVVVHRDLKLRGDVPRVFAETATLIGGVLIILGVALGFTSYLVDAEVPMEVSRWVEAHIGNKLLFILMLNLLLLAVGCLMDIYSAIVVIVPLIIPISAVFGIHPVHLGILFLANLELGYLTPPVGLNLFLASFRFKMPLTTVYKLVLPFLAVQLLGVLLIAYVPLLTTWPLDDSASAARPIDLFEEVGAEDEEAPAEVPSMEDMLEELE